MTETTFISKPLLIAIYLLFAHALALKAEVCQCDDCCPRVALKTNLLHDAVLTPDLGVELSIARRFSISVAGQYAWWSNDSKHRYWRIRGGVVEMRLWPGEKPKHRALTGHHIGIYGSMYDYDFEFGGRGWQSPKLTYGIGVGYGYSLRLNDRLNLDLGLRVGYTALSFKLRACLKTNVNNK